MHRSTPARIDCRHSAARSSSHPVSRPFEQPACIVHCVAGMMKQTLLAIFLVACGATPGARPHDMSAAQHEQEAGQQAASADREATQYDPNARAVVQGCRPQDGSVCWVSKRNPTAKHRDLAERYRRAAADHRAASAALREAEAKACVGVDPDDRDMSPFVHTEDIVNVEPLVESRRAGSASPPEDVVVGVRVWFASVPGLSKPRLERQVACHLARNATLGHNLPEMPDCPLVPNGASARVVTEGSGIGVEIRADDPKTTADIIARANRLSAR